MDVLSKYIIRFPLLFAGCLLAGGAVRTADADGSSVGDLGVTEGHFFAPSSSAAMANTEGHFNTIE